jgi:nucleoid-associated protein YgaU
MTHARVGEGDLYFNQDKWRENMQQASLPTVHKVAEGETLKSIAQKYYGDSSKWHTIYYVNRRIIGSNPNMLEPGKSLTIKKIL